MTRSSMLERCAVRTCCSRAQGRRARRAAAARAAHAAADHHHARGRYRVADRRHRRGRGVFSYPDWGGWIFAIERHDLPLIQASILVIAAIYCFANLVADLLYAYFNPKIRYGRTRS
jgi:ABC-type microcin C transport system permease subunit YejB